MLVLSRKLSEQIQIGPDITITIVEIDRGKVRIGIEAPQDVAIFRSELLNRGGTNESLARRDKTNRR